MRLEKNTLNREFKYILGKLNRREDFKELLCKIGIYSYNVKEHKSMHQGKILEDFMIEMLDAVPYDNDGYTTQTYYGNCDFYLNKLPISLKSCIRKDGVFSKDGNFNQMTCKIFDMSRKSISSVEYKDVLRDKLDSIGWEIPLLFYAFDAYKNKGVLFFTSLGEICETKYKYKSLKGVFSKKVKDNILNLFKFNSGAHFNLSVKDAYDSAKINNRVLEFDINQIDKEDYIIRKRKNKTSIIKEII